MGGKGSGGARANSGGAQIRAGGDADKAFNARVIAFNRRLYAYDLVDFEPENVEARFLEYLAICEEHGMKPGTTSAALAFGLDVRRFNEIARGAISSYRGWKVTPATTEAFQKIYRFLESVLEGYLSGEGKNPAKWIFLAKNHFGYSDTSERIVTHREEGPALPSAEEVAARYAAKLGRPVPELGEAELVGVEDAP